MSSTEDMVRRSLHARADLTTYQPTSALDVARRARAFRRRRTGTVALVAAAAVVTVGVPAGLMLSANDLDRTGTPASTPPTRLTDPSRDPVPAPPRLIAYDRAGSDPAEVRTAADANNLAGAPDSFKEFIGRTARRLTGSSTCTDGYVGVTVRRLRTDGYAVGGVNDCGGYAAMWAIVDGDWKEIDATQDLWDCAVLAKYQVPSAIAGDSCYDDDARAQRPYRQA
jgi:hypothetical protein